MRLFWLAKPRYFGRSHYYFITVILRDTKVAQIFVGQDLILPHILKITVMRY